MRIDMRLLLPVTLAGLAGCATIGDAVDESYSAGLSGAQEVPGPGDPDGAGSAEITVVDATDNVCYKLNVTNIMTPTAAHIHRGAAGVAGPPVVTLEPPVDGERDGCVVAGELIAEEIEANPANFYVNVHNAEYPSGAVRGQLRNWE